MSENLKEKFISPLLVFIICNILMLFFFAQQYFFSLNSDKEFLFWQNFVYQFFYFYTWGGLCYFILFTVNKIPLTRSSLLQNILKHLVLGIFVAFAHRILLLYPYFSIYYPEKFGGFFSEGLWYKAFTGTFDDYLMYWFIVGLIYGYQFYNQNKIAQLKAATLETQLANAQLRALKMQLHPHFLFNTMHTISSLMEENVNAAQQMMTKLSSLLRNTLDNSGVQETTLQNELQFLKNYLEIEEIRFQDRLKVEYQLDDKTMFAKIPNLILQPLVENAIKHGISKSIEGSAITISSKLKENNLEVSVSDNGKGNGNKTIIEGIGLTNTRNRLQQLYGEEGKLIISDSGSLGFSVTISIPFNLDKADE